MSFLITGFQHTILETVALLRKLHCNNRDSRLGAYYSLSLFQTLCFDTITFDSLLLRFYQELVIHLCVLEKAQGSGITLRLRKAQDASSTVYFH